MGKRRTTGGYAAATRHFLSLLQDVHYHSSLYLPAPPAHVSLSLPCFSPPVNAIYPSYLWQRSPPPPQLPDLTDGGPKNGVDASPNNAAGSGGELARAPSAAKRTVLGDGRNSHTSSSRSLSGGGSKADLRTHTRVPPMLLLRGVPEAVMCQLVLAGWEQSSRVGGGGARGTSGGAG